MLQVFRNCPRNIFSVSWGQMTDTDAKMLRVVWDWLCEQNELDGKDVESLVTVNEGDFWVGQIQRKKTSADPHSDDKKVNLPSPTHEDTQGEHRKALLILNLGTRWGEVATFTLRSLYLREIPWYQFNVWGWLGPRAVLDVLGNRWTSGLYRGSKAGRSSP